MAGGYNGGGYYLQSTEILVGSSAAWAVTANLPTAVDGNRAITVNNMVFHTGEVVVCSMCNNDYVCRWILSWDCVQG